jgi:hypothetical protein
VLFAVAGLAIALGGSRGAGAQGGPSIGIDVDPTGNQPASLGARNVCLEVRKGDRFQIDLVAENMTGLSAWETYMSFDANVVNVVDRDVQQFLATAAGGNVFDISESVPDDDPPYRVGGAIISDPPASVDGSGVLARLTLEAMGSGLTTISLAPIRVDVGTIGPTFTNVDGGRIGDSNGDSYFDGPFLDGQIAVDQPCPGSEGVTPASLASSSGGLAWWVFLAIAAGIVAAAGIGGVAFFRLRRAGSNPSS